MWPEKLKNKIENYTNTPLAEEFKEILQKAKNPKPPQCSMMVREIYPKVGSTYMIP